MIINYSSTSIRAVNTRSFAYHNNLGHIVHVVVRADAGGVVVVSSAENGPAEAISVMVWSVMAVKGRPGHRRHGLDCHLVDAGEAGRPKEVRDPDMISSLLACECSGNVVYCHLTWAMWRWRSFWRLSSSVSLGGAIFAIANWALPMTIPQAIWRRSGPLGMLYDSLLIMVARCLKAAASLACCGLVERSLPKVTPSRSRVSLGVTLVLSIVTVKSWGNRFPDIITCIFVAFMTSPRLAARHIVSKALCFGLQVSLEAAEVVGGRPHAGVMQVKIKYKEAKSL
jgi:hypothetical protein